MSPFAAIARAELLVATYPADSVTTAFARPLVKAIPGGSGRRAPASGHAAPAARVHTPAIGEPKPDPIPPTAIRPSALIARACCKPRSLNEEFSPLTTYACAGVLPLLPNAPAMSPRSLTPYATPGPTGIAEVTSNISVPTPVLQQNAADTCTSQ